MRCIKTGVVVQFSSQVAFPLKTPPPTYVGDLYQINPGCFPGCYVLRWNTSPSTRPAHLTINDWNEDVWHRIDIGVTAFNDLAVLKEEMDAVRVSGGNVACHM